MAPKPTTVDQYLAQLPDDRRQALQAVRKTILANLDRSYAEGMQYGMIGYFVPHSVFPAGYHCDPKQPLPFAGLASKSGHMSLHLMGLYVGGDGTGETEASRWFRKAWERTGKKLDMGKACVRFKKLEDVPLDVIGEAIRRMPAKDYIALYQGVLDSRATRTPVSRETIAKKAAAKKVAKKTAVKKTAARTKKPAAAKRK